MNNSVRNSQSTLVVNKVKDQSIKIHCEIIMPDGMLMTIPVYTLTVLIGSYKRSIRYNGEIA